MQPTLRDLQSQMQTDKCRGVLLRAYTPSGAVDVTYRRLDAAIDALTGTDAVVSTPSVRFAEQVSVGEMGMVHCPSKRKFRNTFELARKKLGEGACSSVCQGTDIITRATRAVKVMGRKHPHLDHFRQEVAIMKMMDHPNIIKLHECFEDDHSSYLVMELCEGGTLLDRVMDAGSFTEAQAAMVMLQIVRPIHYMHQKQVCHRDVNPENFLFTSKGPIENSSLKLVDFGGSCSVEPDRLLTLQVGSVAFMAPEVISGKYSERRDHVPDALRRSPLLWRPRRRRQADGESRPFRTRRAELEGHLV